MRATAYLRRAYGHRGVLASLVARVRRNMPDDTVLGYVQQISSHSPGMAVLVLDRLRRYCEEKDSLYQATKFRYGLYEFALLKAADDVVRATQLLPNYAKCWVRAGDVMAELRKLREVRKAMIVAALQERQLRKNLLFVALCRLPNTTQQQLILTQSSARFSLRLSTS